MSRETERLTGIAKLKLNQIRMNIVVKKKK